MTSRLVNDVNDFDNINNIKNDPTITPVSCRIFRDFSRSQVRRQFRISLSDRVITADETDLGQVKCCYRFHFEHEIEGNSYVLIFILIFNEPWLERPSVYQW